MNSKLQDETNPDVERTSLNSEVIRNEKGEPMIGRLAGGKHITEDIEDIDSDCGPIKKVECDMPLTLTEMVEHEGKEYIVLTFATGDKENPFNWNPVCSFLTYCSSLTDQYPVVQAQHNDNAQLHDSLYRSRHNGI